MKKIKVPSATLSRARELQGDYKRLKVASTQNVRNPFPMHTLIQCVLPRHTEEKADTIREVLGSGRPLQLTALGKKFARQYNRALAEVRASSGMTVSDITDVLTAKGFLVNKATVKSTISANRFLFGAFHQPAECGKRGRGESLYYVRS